MEQVQRSITGSLADSSQGYDDGLTSRPASKWIAPLLGWARLHVDGSFLRASSTMGCVSLLRDHNGNWIHGFASYKGIGEIFQDELIDVIQGLSMAWKAGTKVFISLFVDLIVWMLLRH